MADDKPQYVTRCMKGKCSFGSMSQYLNLPLDHGVWYHDQETPIMNANDHEPEKHILQFGRCTSEMNPGNTINMEDVMLGIIMGPVGFFGSKQLKKLMGCDGCKCKPMTLTPWKNAEEKYYIDGAPALTVESYLDCYYGGKITIDLEADAENDAKDAEDEKKEEEKKTGLSKLPPSMQNAINDFCNDGSADGTSDMSNVNATNDVASNIGSTNAGSTTLGSGTASSRTVGATVAGDAAMYAVSPATSQEHYQHNKSQTIPKDALAENGNIIHQEMMGDYQLGNGTLASQGEGVIAAYNMMNMFSKSPKLENIIQFYEALPYALGKKQLGENSFGFMATAMYMMSQNMEIGIVSKKTQQSSKKFIEAGKEVASMSSSIRDRKKSTVAKGLEGSKALVAITGKLSKKEQNQGKIMDIHSNPIVGELASLQASIEDDQIMLMVGQSSESFDEMKKRGGKQ